MHVELDLGEVEIVSLTRFLLSLFLEIRFPHVALPLPPSTAPILHVPIQFRVSGIMGRRIQGGTSDVWIK